MSVTLAFYKGLGKKRCFIAIFLGFFTVFLMNFIGFSVAIEVIVDYIKYIIMQSADTIISIQFDTGKQDYDVIFLSYDSHVYVYLIV